MSVPPGVPARVPVVIVGGGPAGLLLARLLRQAGVDSVILERQTREHVMGRVRAGVLEWGTVGVLRAAGVGERMDREGTVHDGVGLSFSGRHVRIDFKGLTGKGLMIYGQTQVTKDLYDAVDADGVPVVDAADDVTPHDVESTAPYVTLTKDGADHRIDCAYVAGCDGAHGVCLTAIPASVVRTYERVYPFGWLGILSETPPVDKELIYAHSGRGFALCSMRHAMLSRYYVQCPIEDAVEDWPDERFWHELRGRLPPEVVDRLATGPSIEKSITPLRSFVAEPLRHGRLVLAGDAGHVVPPTGAKGLNLAVSDVHYLAPALADAVRGRSTTGLDEYSDRALARVWKAVRFSWWLTTLMHRFPGSSEFDRRIQEAELDYLAGSEAARQSFAENYTGLPL
ncbi:MAG TPA: 4-hydroxybenzoate 3-monooxygenase [Acidimicrobiales bacterium]|jgi:p-hydroxybenzoate 3-monooxygenase|nr:4-hydroxybenzoate 3-monooxygenase [Acidimicrobiales bacterium]